MTDLMADAWVVIADYFLREPEELRPDMRLVEDLGADSLEILEIAMSLNDRLGIELPERALGKVKTVGDLCTLASYQLT